MFRILPAVTACLCLAVALPATAPAKPSGRDHHATTAKKKSTKAARGLRGARGLKGDSGAAGAKGDSGLAGANGAKGDKGETGLAGSNGANGTNGTNGATTVTVRTNSALLGAGGSAYVKANCPAGQKATGGGGSWTDGNQLLSRSMPSTAGSTFLFDGETPTAWTVFGFNNGAGQATLVAYVVCAAP